MARVSDSLQRVGAPMGLYSIQKTIPKSTADAAVTMCFVLVMYISLEDVIRTGLRFLEGLEYWIGVGS